MKILNSTIATLALLSSVQVLATPNPNTDINTFYVNGNAKGNITGMDLRFSQKTDVSSVGINNNRGILVGYCSSHVGDTTKDPISGEWFKSIVDGVTPKGATGPDTCVTNQGSGGLSLVGQIVAIRVGGNPDPELSGDYTLCVNRSCSK